MASAQNDKLVILRGDDTGGAFGRTLVFTIEAAEGVSLDGCKAEWIFDGIVKAIDAPLVPGEVREIFYSHNETRRMELGVRYGTFRIIDAAGKVRTFTNTKAVEVTDNVARCYPGSSSATVIIGTTIAWEQIAGKPLLVKTINGEPPDANGNIALAVGGDVKHADFADIEEKEGMTLKEVGSMCNALVRKLKGMVAAFVALLAFGAFADGLGPNTDFGDIHPTNKLKAVVEASGAISGIDTNAVRDIVNEQLLTNGIRRVDGAARPLPKYLHALDFADSYPDAAQEYYRSRGDGKVDGGCSAVRDGGFLSRNFDYPFDERAEFVVKMSAGPNRFASVGVAQVGTNLTEQIVTSGKPEYSHLYNWLPGATVDGINENGVVCEINVYHDTYGWRETGEIHFLGAVRWVLDHATNAADAARYIADHVYIPIQFAEEGNSFHWMIADEDETWIVERGAATKITNYAKLPSLTNYLVLINRDEYQYNPEIYASVGMGGERLTLLTNGASITNAWYTNAYRRETNPPWVTDLSDVLAYTNDIFDAWASHPKEYFRNKTSGGQPWWQTVHTSVYDISNRVLRVAVQETDDWYTFQVPSAGTDEAAVRKIAESVVAPVASSVSGLQSSKADKATTYTKAETAFNLKAKRDCDDAKFYTKEWDYSVFYDIYGRDGEYSFAYPVSYDGSYVCDLQNTVYGSLDYSDKYATEEELLAAVSAGRITWSNGSIVLMASYSTVIPVRSFVHAPDATTTGVAAFDGKGRLKAATEYKTRNDYGIEESGDAYFGNVLIDNEISVSYGGSINFNDNPVVYGISVNGGEAQHGDVSLTIPVVSATDSAFSNAVLAVEFNFATNEVTSATYIAATNVLAQLGFDEDVMANLPGGKVYGSLGALLVALAAGLKWLKGKLGALASGYSTFAEWITSKRDITDNTCHRTEGLGFNWVATPPLPEGYVVSQASTPELEVYWVVEGPDFVYTIAYGEDATLGFLNDAPWGYKSVFTRQRTSVNEEKFVTTSYVDGDEFAYRLLGKQVANAKVRYALATTSSAAMADRTVNLYEMNGNGTITFPTATTHEGVTYARDFLIRVKVTTAGSLTLPTDVTPLGDSFDFTKANDWLIAFTEIGKDANNKAEFYIRAISLEG